MSKHRAEASPADFAFSDSAVGSTVTANSSNNNQGHGFDAGGVPGSTFTGNTSSLNGGIGFRVNRPSSLIGNTAIKNGTPRS